MRAGAGGSWRERPRGAWLTGTRLADLAKEADDLVRVDQPQPGHQAGQRPRRGNEGILRTGQEVDVLAAAAPDEQPDSEHEGELDERPRREPFPSQAAVAVTAHVAVTPEVDGDRS